MRPSLFQNITTDLISIFLRCIGHFVILFFPGLIQVCLLIFIHTCVKTEDSRRSQVIIVAFQRVDHFTFILTNGSYVCVSLELECDFQAQHFQRGTKRKQSGRRIFIYYSWPNSFLYIIKNT